MPAYDFQCQECGEVFEVFRRFSELDKKVQCPSCSSEKTTRIFSVPHIEGETVAGSGYGTKLPGSASRTGGGRGLGRGLRKGPGRGRGMGRMR